MLSPGRNNLFETIYRAITFWIPGTQISGKSSPTTYTSSVTARSWDSSHEILEIPIRSGKLAAALIEIVENCPEAETAIDIIVGDVFSSESGDDESGFKISDTLKDNETPVNPRVKKILDNLITRVIGGLTLEAAAERSLSFGDAFASIGIAKYSDGLGISKIMFLPTWEIFRIEDEQGNLVQFEQRKRLDDPNPIVFHPVQIVHWRYRKKFLYGRSLYKVCIPDWEDLKQTIQDYKNSVHAIGVNPNVHVMHEGADEKFKKSYKQDYEERLKEGNITDFFLMHGADLKKLSNVNPDLSSVLNAVNFFRSRIAMRFRIPSWLLTGLPQEGSAKDISGQPALAYARFVNRIRATMSEGISRLCDVELALKGIPPEERLYQLVWPQIYTSNAIADKLKEDDHEDSGTNRETPESSEDEEEDAIDLNHNDVDALNLELTTNG